MQICSLPFANPDPQGSHHYAGSGSGSSPSLGETDPDSTHYLGQFVFTLIDLETSHKFLLREYENAMPYPVAYRQYSHINELFTFIHTVGSEAIKIKDGKVGSGSANCWIRCLKLIIWSKEHKRPIQMLYSMMFATINCCDCECGLRTPWGDFFKYLGRKGKAWVALVW